MQRSQSVRPYKVRRQPSETLTRQRERIRNVGVIPVPAPTSSKISLQEIDQINQKWATNTAKRREEIRHERLKKMILPTPLTEQEKQKCESKKKKFEKDYKAEIASARAVFNVKKCMAELGVRESRRNITNFQSIVAHINLIGVLLI